MFICDCHCDTLTELYKKGTSLYADRSKLPSLPDDEYYHTDLIGMEVRDTGGALIGRDSLQARVELGERRGLPRVRRAGGAKLGQGRGGGDSGEGVIPRGVNAAVGDRGVWHK